MNTFFESHKGSAGAGLCLLPGIHQLLSALKVNAQPAGLSLNHIICMAFVVLLMCKRSHHQLLPPLTTGV